MAGGQFFHDIFPASILPSVIYRKEHSWEKAAGLSGLLLAQPMGEEQEGESRWPPGLASTLTLASDCVWSLGPEHQTDYPWEGPKFPGPVGQEWKEHQGLASILLSWAFEETCQLAFCGLTYLPFECGIIKILMLWKHNWYIFKSWSHSSDQG